GQTRRQKRGMSFQRSSRGPPPRLRGSRVLPFGRVESNRVSDTEKPIVAMERVERDLRGSIGRALDAAGFSRHVPKGADVSLKVNLGWDLFIPGSITSPFFAE